MSSFVCILHTTGTTYDASLLSQAAYATSALFHSVCASAPDFIPTVAVLRANGVEGVQYAYTASPADGPREADGAPDSDPTAPMDAVAGALTGRSAAALCRAVRRRPAALGGDCAARNRSPDVWRPVAAAVLTACCFLRAHSGGAAGRAVLLFTDADADGAPLSVAAECALSAAAVALNRLRAALSVFGADALRGPAGCRLRAMAHATGGVCAEAFALSHVGRMVDGDALGVGAGGEEADGLLPRKRRERLVEQYVFEPVHLARDTTQAARASHLAWLCPSCMVVMARNMGETEAAARGCPYCSPTTQDCEKTNGRGEGG